MERLGRILTMLDKSLNTKRRRHITGGILASISLLFGGLALTVITLKREDDSIEDNTDEYEAIYLE